MEIKDEGLDWLLAQDDPSVRYRTLTELLEKAPDDPEVQGAKAQIQASKAVAKIFSKMEPEGYWFYFDKRANRGAGDGVEYFDYVTTHFNLAFLAELGLDRTDERISLTVERYLGLQQPDGDFYRHFSCLYTYNWRTLVMMGYKEDERVQKTVNLMLKTDRHDGGYLCDWHEGKYKNKPTKSCIRGSVKALMAFAALPELWSTARCQKLVSYFLQRRICFRMDQPDQPINGEITGALFPFVWRASLLEALYALSMMGYGQREELNRAWDLLAAKKNEEGKYVLDWSPTRAYFKPGKRGVSNKWITLYAYLALKYKDRPTKLV
jgi:hypothetical protein